MKGELNHEKGITETEQQYSCENKHEVRWMVKKIKTNGMRKEGSHGKYKKDEAQQHSSENGNEKTVESEEN